MVMEVTKSITGTHEVTLPKEGRCEQKIVILYEKGRRTTASEFAS
jgi:hypothetical protein